MLLVMTAVASAVHAENPMQVTGNPPANETVALPEPRTRSEVSLEQALSERRSRREYRDAAVSLSEIGQLAWAAQGITHAGYRSAPSAGALYPLELYVVVGKADGVASGVYRYLPGGHRLKRVRAGDLRADLARAALGQDCVRDAAAILVFTAVERRSTRKYGARGVRYIHMEVGHAAQNAFLQATALGLGAVVVGAFDDRAAKLLIGLPAEEEPLYLVPFGRL
jgi:SagB-type dehydrogenase family enzyme